MNGIRVGFITIHRGINFGTALQTFAMHTALERLGYSATLIDYQYPAKYHLSKAARDENRKRFSFLERFPLVFSVARTIKRLMTGEFWETRRQKDKFRAFLDRIPHTKEYDMAGIEKDPPQFDIYLTGSDQCWNPRYMHHDHSMLLNFAPDSAPKIAYASSFGCSELGPEFREEYRHYLLRYNALSVRERSGCSLIEDLTGRKDARYVLDPTFLLDGNDWLNAIKSNTIQVKGKYILCYILDYVFNVYPAINAMIEEVRKAYGLPLVFIGKNLYPARSNVRTLMDVGPEDFLDLVSKAAFVVTTSFHGTAFSINFRKDFLAILNPNQSLDDRVANILKATGMSDRGVLLGGSVSEVLKHKTDYSAQAEKCISDLRQESLSFLSNELRKCTGLRNDRTV
ncbi:MAG: polysaccharide pyruvyl transferase family protein [Lentisphaeria bacterium]|nr:polysaccharide pyruvyl transferase family protein [Lentisphaeria bacterium]